MQDYLISGVQQIGIGTENLEESWKWYIEHFQVDVRILEDDTVAELMLPYTGNVPQKRHACIAINMQGGGGFEIWQYSERKPKPVDFEIRIGDLGIVAAKIKSRNVAGLYKEITAKYDKTSDLVKAPDGTDAFFLKDPFGNYFQIVHDEYVFIDEKRLAGGATGAMIGVADIDRAMPVYRDILGYDTVIYDETGVFEDWKFLPGGDERYRRVLLGHSQPRRGAFSGLLGGGTIELVVALDRKPRKIYEGRFWGDPGFIQICFDITNMDALRDFCRAKGFPFTVDSAVKHSQADSFDMGEAAGHFTYIEDPDGTLIELVETHKIPIIKKLGINLNLRTRNREKKLPKLMLRFLALNRVKFD